LFQQELVNIRKFSQKDMQVASIVEVSSRNLNNELQSEYKIGEPIKILLKLKVSGKVSNLISAVGICNKFDVPITTSWQPPQDVNEGFYAAEFLLNKVILASGTYKFNVSISTGSNLIEYIESALEVSIISIIHNLESSVKRFDGGSGFVLNQMEMKLESC
jgi:hypothetical protein